MHGNDSLDNFRGVVPARHGGRAGTGAGSLMDTILFIIGALLFLAWLDTHSAAPPDNSLDRWMGPTMAERRKRK